MAREIDSATAEAYLSDLAEKMRRDYRAVVLEDRTPADQAARRDVTAATVRWNVNRARDRLRELAAVRGHPDGSRKCALCRYRFADDADMAAILRHYTERHADADAFRDVIDDVRVRVDCSDCEEAFVAALNWSADRFHAPAYCPDCREEGYRRAVVSELSPQDVVERDATGCGERGCA